MRLRGSSLRVGTSREISDERTLLRSPGTTGSRDAEAKIINISGQQDQARAGSTRGSVDRICPKPTAYWAAQNAHDVAASGKGNASAWIVVHAGS